MYREAVSFNIIYEGFVTYGGMSGRDMGVLDVGLNKATEFGYLESRIHQVHYLDQRLEKCHYDP